MDISESKYIDEKNKKELIDFTYDVFKDFEIKQSDTIEDKGIKKSGSKILLAFLSTPVILFIISEVLVIIATINSPSNIKPEDNIMIALPLLLGFISLVLAVISMFSKVFESRVSKKMNHYYIYSNIFSEKSNKNKA